MKINPNLEPQGSQGASGAGAAGVVNASRAAQSGQSGTTDKADLSSDAQQFAQLSGQAANVPAVRQDRVDSLRSAIQSGTYSVSNQQIARSMARDFSSGS